MYREPREVTSPAEPGTSVSLCMTSGDHWTSSQTPFPFTMGTKMGLVVISFHTAVAKHCIMLCMDISSH